MSPPPSLPGLCLRNSYLAPGSTSSPRGWYRQQRREEGLRQPPSLGIPGKWGAAPGTCCQGFSWLLQALAAGQVLIWAISSLSTAPFVVSVVSPAVTLTRALSLSLSLTHTHSLCLPLHKHHLLSHSQGQPGTQSSLMYTSALGTLARGAQGWSTTLMPTLSPRAKALPWEQAPHKVFESASACSPEPGHGFSFSSPQSLLNLHHWAGGAGGDRGPLGRRRGSRHPHKAGQEG